MISTIGAIKAIHDMQSMSSALALGIDPNDLGDMQTVATFPLAVAMLCVNCDNVTNAAACCTKCGSDVLVPLRNWLGRVGEPPALQTNGSGVNARDEENPTLTPPTVSRIGTERNV